MICLLHNVAGTLVCLLVSHRKHAKQQETIVYDSTVTGK